MVALKPGERLRIVSINVVPDGTGVAWYPAPIEVTGEPDYVPHMMTTRIHAGSEPFLKARGHNDREAQDLIDAGLSLDEICAKLEG